MGAITNRIRKRPTDRKTLPVMEKGYHAEEGPQTTEILLTIILIQEKEEEGLAL
jgi:hypothetical protein